MNNRLQRITAILLILMALLPIGAWADDDKFDHPSDAFKWENSTTGCIHFTLLIATPIGHDPDRTLNQAVFSLVDENGTKMKCFYVNQTARKSDKDYTTCDYENYLRQESELFLTNDAGLQGRRWVNGTASNNNLWTAKASNGYYYAELDWFYPARFAGKKMKLRVDGKLWHGNGDGSHYTYSKELGTINFEYDFGLFNPVPGTESGEQGLLKVPFSCEHVVNWVEASYTDESGQTKNLGRTTLSPNSYMGFIMLPATEAHRNLKIKANMVISSWSDNPSDHPEYPSKVEGTATFYFDPSNDVVLHNPRHLSAELLQYSDKSLTDAGAIQLTWETRNPKYTDVIDGDQFLIFRSLTGNMDDMTNIASVQLDDEDSVYTYKDSTLVAALTEKHMTLESDSFPTVRYCVIRASAYQLWGMDNNVASAKILYPLDHLHLLRIANYNASWKSEEEKTVNLTWNYVNDYGAAWDNRARMKLLLTTTNHDGAAVDTTLYVLTTEEIASRSKVLQLHRSCVDYKIEMMVERDLSPLPLEAKTVFTIRSADDWTTFANKVAAAKGQYEVNAILAADISVSQTVGTNTAPFCGLFDGNGHTLTFTASSWSKEYIAPFLYVKNATIRNLHVKGTINSSKKFAGGLIARITDDSDEVLVEGCHVSVNLTSGVNGDATNGGIVANAENGKKLILRNCLFDGSFKGDDCHSNGGMVGWSRGQVVIENCVFAPTSLTTFATKCETWARMNTPALLTVINSYCTRDYYMDSEGRFSIRTVEDWNAFRMMVKAVAGNSDVNAILNADITTGNSCGDIGFPYRGTFDGNGHTINIQIVNTGDNEGVFKLVANATIKNLRIAGSVDGGMHSSGLIGGTLDGKVVMISNCRVSATVTSSGTHAGGFVGHGRKGKHIISNCLFDGKLVCTGSGTRYGGSFIGWEANDGSSANATKNELWNCLENGTYENINHAGMNYNAKGSPYGAAYGSNTWSYHGWNECNKVASDATADDVVVALNSKEWRVVNGAAVPLMTSDAVTGYYRNIDSDKKRYDIIGGNNWQLKNDKLVLRSVNKAQGSQGMQPELPTFYYKNTGSVDALTVRELQSSVLLTWTNVDDAPVDYYEVWRRDSKETDFERIATNIPEMQYEDKNTSPVKKYYYFVRSVNDCEGKIYHSSDTLLCHCVQTGTLEGYLRFGDGTGIPKEPITITLDDKVSETVWTDERGFFRKTGLPYFDETETVYTVSSSAPGVSTQLVRFGTAPGENVVSDVVFVCGESVKFSGYVFYEGTSIPVQGANFMVDDCLVHSGTGKVESDHEGKFVFHMMKDRTHIVQAVKDGHTFLREGYYHLNDDDPDTLIRYNYSTNVANFYFYDKTRVKLIGRVCGGTDQGDLPLGNSLSRNNLGDELEMVFTLEGNNTSRLVWDIQNKDLKERNEVFIHQAHDTKYEYKTKVHTTINRMVISPDIHTGEYEVMLPPVKWKIQQITAKGYPTLFQDGQVGDVIDLSDSLTQHFDTIHGSWQNAMKEPVTTVVVDYHAQYRRVYHSPILIDYKQVGYENYDYFGELFYKAKDLNGYSTQVPLLHAKKKADWPANTLRTDSLEAVYTFGYPVFGMTRKYPINISAFEKYYYNNNTKNDTVDKVMMKGGLITVHNGLASTVHTDTLSLNEKGEGTYQLQASQIPYNLTGKDALRTVTFTMLLDGTYYEAVPLKAYVLNQYAKTGAKDILTIGKPVLFDILRDPPGGTSSAKLSKGSTFKSAYTLDMKAAYGAELGVGFGTSFDTWFGFGAGTYNRAGNLFQLDLDLVWNLSGQHAYSYTMTANTDISTSSATTMVGADADVYIGMETNVFLRPSVSIRALPDSMYQRLRGEEEAGRLVVIAEGTDTTGDALYLVRDEIMAVGQTVQSTFAHSQQYILNQLIPELEEQCLSLMFTGSYEEAVLQANATQKPVYWSLRDPEDEDFGFLNTTKKVTEGDCDWEYVYNTTVKEAKDGLNYMIVLPNGWDPNNKDDQVLNYCESMLQWMSIISQNECEKRKADKLMRNFDIDGGATLSYSEEFSSQYDISNSNTNIATNFQYGVGWEEGVNFGVTQFIAAGLKAGAKKISEKILNAMIKKKTGNERHSKNNLEAVGIQFSFSLVPVIECNYTPKYTDSQKYTRKESFTIGMDRKSHLDFDVYYAPAIASNKEATSWNDVFTNQPFDAMDKKVTDQIFSDLSDLSSSNLTFNRGFIYRTRGGATCRPYEGERTTKYYNRGEVLDERTKKIENPIIQMDKQSISGVPYGDPARFKLYFTNESEQPEAAYPFFDIYQNEKHNPKGAKMMIDGMPLTGNMRTIRVEPGQVTEKTLEVYASEDFDYEGLRIGIVSQGDVNTNSEVKFDVHFLHTAGPVEISTPGDRWIMNTDASYEEGKGWYMPVVISGFNKNQYNFDHIEFQYKESTRGDDYWTNLCGYYADSTRYAAASGTKSMIPENGNIITRFFGEGTIMEKAYDLRAVLFCRNGNSFLTSSSKVLSGVKDTRRPQLFGTPDPRDGVLGAGDNIVFHFSEDIEYNYLQDATNFEVTGETNENSVQEAPSLQFGGNGYAQSEARRNFTDKNFTIEVMIKPDNVNKAMPIFSHGIDGRSLQLWITADKHLKAVVDDKELVSDSIIDINGFQRVALSIDNDKKILSLFSKLLDDTIHNVSYSGYGPLIFGSTNQTDVSKRKFFEGRMLQARVWNRALNISQLNEHANRMLTGYEMGLTDYYPMNEGKGEYVLDLAQGAHLKLDGASWAQPRGMALKLDWAEAKTIKGLQLKDKFFQRTNEEDYTLMFWFKTTEKGRGALLSNGSGRTTDVGAENKFFIGFEGKTLKYRSNGHEFALGDELSDDEWHHYAMTVNRGQQVASIYIDNAMKAQFSIDWLGGMAGDFYLGNMVWKEQGPNPDVLHYQNALTGYIDGVALFEQALPPALIERFTAKAIGGKEKGLITYLDFDHQERQKNGNLTLRPYALNKKVIFDQEGNPTDQHDTVFVEPVDTILNHIDQNIGAPVQAYEELRNLNFSFVGRDNQVLVNIDELDKRINKRKVYVTVRDIPDLNGNYMASPATFSVFVDRNPLRWSQRTYRTTISSEEEADNTFDINIENNSGATHTYTITDMPKWLSVDRPSDMIDARSEQTLCFTISKDINVGTYDDIIYLTDENGLAEPLALNITIEGKVPQWEVSSSMKQFSMSIVARVEIGNDIATDSRDMVAVFDAVGRCMGVANVSYDPSSAESLVFLTVYDSTTVSKRLGFRLWNYDTGKVMALKESQKVNFVPETFVGTTKEPLVLRANNQYIQRIELQPGWNWISLNVINNDYRDVKKLLSWFQWQDGDMLTDETNNISLLYMYGQWLSNKGTKSIDELRLTVSQSYRVKVANTVAIELEGSAIKTKGDRTIRVKPGWNSIGYTPLVNLPLSTALSDYLDQAEDGDVVKSKNEFAMFTKGTNGARQWKGNLKYMKPGDGYMLFRRREGEVTFFYPFYEASSTFFEGTGGTKAPMCNTYGNNMTLTALAQGIELQEADRIIAYANGEERGEAQWTKVEEDELSQLFYLTIAGDKQVPLSFAIERNGEIIATTGEIMTYKVNEVSGSYQQPTNISFARINPVPQHGWYTLEGVKLNGKPTRSGVYIYNGHKQVIK